MFLAENSHENNLVYIKQKPSGVSGISFSFPKGYNKV